MDEKIFDRIEKKYLLTREQEQKVLKVIKDNMTEDKYFKSEVFNIYFDNDNFDTIIKSIESPAFKEKLRARSYGGYNKVFLEIKTKLKGKEYNVGYKRRVLISREDYEDLVGKRKTALELARQKIETPDDLQIAKEVDYLIDTLDLKPRILVYYQRESYLGENGLRITFDSDLKYRDQDLNFKSTKKDRTFFKDETNIIMEIKAHEVLPLWLVKALSKEKLYPTKFSKIGRIYQELKKGKNVWI